MSSVKNKDSEDMKQQNKFSVLGLLKIINSNQNNDQELTNQQKLALGFDLTTLGLNLNAPDFLHETFSAPYIDNSPYCVQPNFELPDCYKNFPFTHKRIYKRVLLETLFYIFYSMPNDANQIRAAKELINRGWSYHKTLQLWMKCMKVIEKQPEFTKGNYIYFDILTWGKKPKKNFVFRKSQKFKISSIPTKNSIENNNASNANNSVKNNKSREESNIRSSSTQNINNI